MRFSPRCLVLSHVINLLFSISIIIIVWCGPVKCSLLIRLWYMDISPAELAINIVDPVTEFSLLRQPLSCQAFAMNCVLIQIEYFSQPITANLTINSHGQIIYCFLHPPLFLISCSHIMYFHKCINCNINICNEQWWIYLAWLSALLLPVGECSIRDGCGRWVQAQVPGAEGKEDLPLHHLQDRREEEDGCRGEGWRARTELRRFCR